MPRHLLSFKKEKDSARQGEAHFKDRMVRHTCLMKVQQIQPNSQKKQNGTSVHSRFSTHFSTKRLYMNQSFNESRSSERSENGNFIFVRFRRVPSTGKILDAWDYGHKAWKIPTKHKKHQPQLTILASLSGEDFFILHPRSKFPPLIQPDKPPKFHVVERLRQEDNTYYQYQRDDLSIYSSDPN